ncbi:MAG: hypothetical protein QM790_00380 [Nibricoccus sp.]
MNRNHKHQRSHAGTSLTKAVAYCCVQMRPVVSNWTKQIHGAGSQA